MLQKREREPGSDILKALRSYYKRSEGYREHLVAKPAAYFERYVSVVQCLARRSALVLDLGCGSGTSTKLISSRGVVAIGADISPLFLSASINRRTLGPVFVASDAAHLPFPDCTFDVVGAMEFIEHIWPVEPVLREMARVLRPGGKIVINGPNLLSPLWPIRDLPGILRGRFRPPHYASLRESLAYFGRAFFASARKQISGVPRFLPRRPELALADHGGDYDATYQAHPRDLILFLRGIGFSACYARWPVSTRSKAFRMRVTRLLGPLWTSFVLVATKEDR